MTLPSTAGQQATAIRTAPLTAAAWAGMFVFGLVMAILGAVLPALSGRLQFSVADIGTLFFVMNFAMLVTSLLLGVALDRFGMKPPLAAAPWLVAAALILIAGAESYSRLLPAVLLLGVGGGALNGATNTLVADLHDDPNRKASALNLLGVFFGFGALFLPFSLGALLDRFGASGLLHASAALCGAIALYALTLRFPAPKHPMRLPVSEMPRFLRMHAVLIMAFLLFFQSGNEFILGGFLTTFLTRQLGAGVAEASWVLAAFWGGIMAARIFLSRILLRYDGHQVILVSAIASAAAAILIGAAPALWIAAPGIAAIGVALAGIFPTQLGLAGSRFQAHSGTVFGIMFTIALSGGMTMPWIAGQLGEAAGLRYVFVLVAANFMAIAMLNAIAARAGEA